MSGGSARFCMVKTAAFSGRVAKAICARIAAGEGLRTICGDEGMPTAWAVLERAGYDTRFARQMAQAREAQADALFEELQAIADAGNPSDATRARLRVDTLKWRLARMNPKKYSDKVGLMGAQDGEAPATVERIERIIVRAAD